jgi:hypothetical protein
MTFCPAFTQRATSPSLHGNSAAEPVNQPTGLACVGDGRRDLTPPQRESAIDQAQRRARVHKEAYSASLHDYIKTGRRVYLDVAHIHRQRAEECERQTKELMEGREA